MTKIGLKAYPVLLAGGMGSRLWPISRELYPKQLINLVGGDSLIQSTIKRLSPVLVPENTRVVCGEDHYYEIARHLEAIGVPAEGKLITEPCGRNTAPAIAVPAIMLLAGAFSVRKPETGYGYIEGAKKKGDALEIKRFIEKPDEKKAASYIKAGNFFWNSGMFAFKASVMMSEFKKFEPALLETMQKIIRKRGSISLAQYKKLPDISIDYAIMEKTAKGVVLPSDFGWSDIGSWKSLYDILPKDKNQNVMEGDIIARETKNSFIKGEGRLIVANGLDNIVVVETPDTVFVSSLDKTQDVKTIVERLKKEGRKEYKSHTTVYRPWGTYTLLEEKGNSKMKRIVIYPKAKLSLQMHYHRSEHWIVAQGTAKITIGDKTVFLKENQSTYIPKATRHRLENPGKIPLHIIEVQMGSYLEEDDIVRFDDDFGRAGAER